MGAWGRRGDLCLSVRHVFSILFGKYYASTGRTFLPPGGGPCRTRTSPSRGRSPSRRGCSCSRDGRGRFFHAFLLTVRGRDRPAKVPFGPRRTLAVGAGSVHGYYVADFWTRPPFRQKHTGAKYQAGCPSIKARSAVICWRASQLRIMSSMPTHEFKGMTASQTSG